MKENFAAALAAVLTHEGGRVDDPQDPGGRTAFGVTQRVYDEARRDSGLPPRDVWKIGQDEVAAIYRSRYWDAVKGDALPAGVDYAVFDFAVNSGVARASRFLQRVVGVAEDGKIGPVTLAAVRARDANALVADLCCARQAFLQALPTFARFGRGWSRRCAEVQAAAQRLA